MIFSNVYKGMSMHVLDKTKLFLRLYLVMYPSFSLSHVYIIYYIFVIKSSEWKNLNLQEDDNYVIWIGHSTFLIKKDGITILTDPVFSDRASPFRNIGPKRLIPPAIPLDKIPNIDFVTVSHNNYDH